MWFEPIFLTGSLAVFEERGEAVSFFGFSAAPSGARGGKCSSYFKNSAPARKCQVRLARFDGLGDQIVENFWRKNQLAVLN